MFSKDRKVIRALMLILCMFSLKVRIKRELLMVLQSQLIANFYHQIYDVVYTKMDFIKILPRNIVLGVSKRKVKKSTKTIFISKPKNTYSIEINFFYLLLSSCNVYYVNL